MPSLNCRNGFRKFWRYTKLKLISSIWFWLGLLGVSVVTYGVFDALNTQKEKSVSGVDIQNVQVQTQVEINEAANPSWGLAHCNGHFIVTYNNLMTIILIFLISIEILIRLKAF